MRHFAAAAANLVGTFAFCVGCHRPPPAPGIADAGATALSVEAAAPPNLLPMPSASVEAVINPQKLPAYKGPTGSVEGTIFVQGPPAPEVGGLDFKTCPAAMDTYGKLFRAGPPDAQGLRALGDAVVVVTGYSGYYLPDKSPAQDVTIRPDCGYPTRSIATTFGQRLEISNASKLPFAPSLDGVFQPAVMIAPPMRAGDPVKIYPTTPGHYQLSDRLEPFVREELYVLRQPLHAVSGLDGHYRIDGVPATKVKVGALLHAIRSEVQKEVEVRPDVVERVDIVLKYAPTDAGAPVIPHVIP